MIPQFPEFKRLELTDKEEIYSIIQKYPPYSDFNFTSLWSYNTEDDLLISRYKDSLIIRIRDYITNEPFYSFIGSQDLIELTDLILAYSQQQGLPPLLKLIPEAALQNEPQLAERFDMVEDADNFDYIVSVDEIAALSHEQLSRKARQVRRFTREHPDHRVENLNLSDEPTRQSIIALFKHWAKVKHKPEEDTQHELTALSRFLASSHHFNLISLGIFDDNKLIGFITAEILPEHHAMGHFLKADPTHKGIFDYLNHTIAKQLQEKGVKYKNIMQDLGFVGLRDAKKHWLPTHYLKKYIIRPKAHHDSAL